MNAPQKTNIRLLAALKYAELGWPVFPVWWLDENGHCACGENCASPGKHPIGWLAPQGWQNARPWKVGPSNEEIEEDIFHIKYWWQHEPKANIGLVTGDISGLMVFDVDPRNDGDITFAELVQEHGDFTAGCPHATTGGGGNHYFFAWPNGQGAVTSLFPGIDIKADGGYVVAPPSRTYLPYQWVVPPKLHGVPPEAPAWLLEALKVAKPDKTANKDEALVEGDKYTIGNRHNYIVRRAGGLRRNGLNTDLLFQSLSYLNQKWCDPPLGEEELHKIANNPWSEQKPKGIPLTTINDAGEEFTEPQSYKRTDLGNGKRIADRFRGDLCFVKGKKWMFWNGKCWQEDTLERASAMAIQVIEDLQLEADELEDEDERIALGKWAHTSQMGTHTQTALNHAKSMLSIPWERFNRQPYLFNTQNGTIDLRTGELLPHTREHYLTQIAPVVADFDAVCPKWEAYISWAMLERPHMASYLQRVLGSCQIGNNAEELLFIWIGIGSNGKTTILNTLEKVMGTGAFGYVREASASLLTKKRNEQHSTVFAVLEGKRLIICPEPERSQLDIELVKRLTGQKYYSARLMNEDERDIAVSFKPIMMTNHSPRIPDISNATWRRVRFINFDATVAEADRVLSFEDYFNDELPGILNWLIDGCLAAQEGGMREPPEVLAATAQRREDNDSLADFIKSNLVFVSGTRCSTAAVWDRYRLWAAQVGTKFPMQRRSLTENLMSRGWPTKAGKARLLYFQGVHLLEMSLQFTKSSSKAPPKRGKGV